MTVSGDLETPLRRLRGAMLSLLALTLPVSEHLLGLPVRYAVALPAVLGLAALFVVQRWFVPARSERGLAIGVALDMLAITGVLAASGGAANPFSVLLLGYVALAAFLFSARFTFALAALSTVAFGALFLIPPPPSCHAPGGAMFSNHLYGMWMAFVLVAALIAMLVTQIRRTLAARDSEIQRLRSAAEQSRRFAALGTLAAGAAHELGTPLATIQVLAADLEDGDSRRDIVAQVERCRAVLRRMDPGVRGELDATSTLSAVVERAVGDWQKAHPDVHVLVSAEGGVTVGLAEKDVAAALSVLLDNAAHATMSAGVEAPILVRAAQDARAPFVEVEDGGPGFDDSLDGRLGEPFVSTKAPGEGMGLGLYLVRKLLEQVNGRLVILRRAPQGSCVRLEFGGAV
ncbi:MAG: ATP-binding protein [Polyangiaceae bacterium]